MAEEVCETIARLTGLPQPLLLTELIKSAESMTWLDPQLPWLLASLRQQGYQIVLATDNMDTLTRWTLPALNLTNGFDGVLSSHALGRFKADQTPDDPLPFFRQYLQSRGLPANQAVLIDDGIHNQRVEAGGLGFIHVTPDYPTTQALHQFL